MLVMLQLADGSEQAIDVRGVRIAVADATVELSLSGSDGRLRLPSPAEDDRCHRFVVHHGAANVMELELRPNDRDSHES